MLSVGAPAGLSAKGLGHCCRRCALLHKNTIKHVSDSLHNVNKQLTPWQVAQALHGAPIVSGENSCFFLFHQFLWGVVLFDSRGARVGVLYRIAAIAQWCAIIDFDSVV
jgi:hypothetical protein